jgi:hypothetical protein
MKQTITNDWSHLYPEYAGLWVAFAKDKETVIGSGKSLKGAIKKAKQDGYKNPLMFKVPQKMLPYVGSF